MIPLFLLPSSTTPTTKCLSSCRVCSSVSFSTQVHQFFLIQGRVFRRVMVYPISSFFFPALEIRSVRTVPSLLRPPSFVSQCSFGSPWHEKTPYSSPRDPPIIPSIRISRSCSLFRIFVPSSASVDFPSPSVTS